VALNRQGAQTHRFRIQERLAPRARPTAAARTAIRYQLQTRGVTHRCRKLTTQRVHLARARRAKHYTAEQAKVVEITRKESAT
jgi:hypothetical protein